MRKKYGIDVVSNKGYRSTLFGRRRLDKMISYPVDDVDNDNWLHDAN